MPIAKDKKQINILLTIEDAERLKAIADKQERSVSQMAAIFIRECLDKAEATKDKGAA
ncbi:hypothetical protein LC653_35935 [Nostoc sp. CHAB 5784]|uniref:ribbon-helix-helix domain-containing protein n=1 Tax=Nostoc mirabile TaxID=2907820 RepID=UPI001E5D6308|nr:hypothetical protein [Nostoc mirabile]MCC5669106.1 hypothetical protein [Nostoc mirabile CHAB5784]